MVNLFLVVIATQFSETKRRETEKIAEERKRYKSSTTLGSTRTDSDGCYNQLLKYIIHLCRRAYRRAKLSCLKWRDKYKTSVHDKKPEHDEPDLTEIQLNVFGNHMRCKPCYHIMALADNHIAPIASPEPSDIDSISYMGLAKQFNCSPRFFRRSDHGSPIIFVSPGQDETSFNSALQPHSSSTAHNGGIKVSESLFIVTVYIIVYVYTCCGYSFYGVIERTGTGNI